jgi:hypothetical protein
MITQGLGEAGSRKSLGKVAAFAAARWPCMGRNNHSNRCGARIRCHQTAVLSNAWEVDQFRLKTSKPASFIPRAPPIGSWLRGQITKGRLPWQTNFLRHRKNANGGYRQSHLMGKFDGTRVFASRRRLDRSSVRLSLVLPELVMNPRSEPQKSFPRRQIARFSLARNGCTAQSARVVGLRQSLVRISSGRRQWWPRSRRPAVAGSSSTQ